MRSGEARALRDRILYDIGSSYPDWRVQMDSYPDAAVNEYGEVEDSWFVTVVTASDADVEVRSWEEWLELKPFGVA